MLRRLSLFIALTCASSPLLQACFPDPDDLPPLDVATADDTTTSDTSADASDASPPADVAADVATDVASDIGLDTAPDSTPDTASDTETPVVPAAPERPSVEVVAGERISLTWSAVPDASAYRVYRCDTAPCDTPSSWVLLPNGEVTATRYDDLTVPEPPPASAPSVSASTQNSMEVQVSWSALGSVRAPTVSYRVTATNDVGESPPSDTADGTLPADAIDDYEIRIDGGLWQRVGNVTVFTDATAPAPVNDAGTVTASKGTFANHVLLTSINASVAPGAERTYEVRALTRRGAGAASAAVSGSRAAGAVTVTWEYSDVSSSDDFLTLAGASGIEWADTTAPTNGSIRYYRAVVASPGAVVARTSAVAGSRIPPPGVPGSVIATTELEASIEVTWQAVDGALGYHVYRDGTRITSAAGTTATAFTDTAAPGPTGAWAAPDITGASVDDPAKVIVTWMAPIRPTGPDVSYVVRAINTAGEGPASAAAIGRRARPALTGYEVEVAAPGSQAFWQPVTGIVESWDHLDAPAGVIEPGTITASAGLHRKHVVLTSEGATVLPTVVNYRVRGVLTGGARTPASGTKPGHRAVGTLEYQWQRSSAAGGTALSYSNIPDATGPTFQDTGAPANGDRRMWRLSLYAAGSGEAMVAPVEGWRLAFTRVAIGARQACAQTTDARLWCWGDSQTNPPVWQAPTRIESLSNVIAFSVGPISACAVTNPDGRVFCWATGQEPYEVQGFGSAATGIRVSGDAAEHACVRLTNGQMACWGDNTFGQLGNGSTTPSTVPVNVVITNPPGGPLTGVTGVPALGADASCTPVSGGSLYCWGANAYGQLGDMSTNPSTVAIKSSVVNTIGSVAAGMGHTCVTASGSVRCWGRNHRGQLGNASTQDSLVANAVVGLEGLSALNVQASKWNTCGRFSDGSMRCWGLNNHDANSDPFFSSVGVEAFDDAYATAPAIVDSLSTGVTWIDMAGGSTIFNACAVKDNDVWCWGNNQRGQLGDMTRTRRKAPVMVAFP